MEYQHTATGTARHALQLPYDDPESICADLVLEIENIPGLRIRIGDLIRRERHADVYSVEWEPPSADDGIGSEARAFVLDGVHGKLKRHRKRCIQRLRHRMWWEATRRGAEIIVYTVNSKAGVVTPEKEDTDSNKASRRVLVPTKRTNYKREAARTRQRERRRQKASQENSLEASSSPQDAELIKDDASLKEEEPTDIFKAAILLYIVFDKNGNQRLVDQLDVPESCMRSSKLVNLYSLLLMHKVSSKFADLHQILNADEWLLHEILQHFRDLECQFSNMSYRQLFMGVHSVLSTLSLLDLCCVPSSNHRFDLLQHIQTTLPILIDNFQTMMHGRLSSEVRKSLL
ncbi:hypothetical protein IWW34DRAFT_729897 [Fusarium oxysporum f. sp. albedinis]|nr:hypothetical protein IWW34DRAFT_729897 [Fusarium oxysporum f. sp. albedinis]